MNFLWNKITEWIKGLLISGIMSNLNGLFDGLNGQVAEIAGTVGTTPQGWNGSVFNMIKSLSDNVIVPIAGAILTFVMCYELIQMVIDKNSFHDFETFVFMKWTIKTAVGVLLLSHAWDMDGKDRLRLLHTIFHLDKREKFNFEWKWLPLTGLSTKDFIAPSSFEFRESRYFKMGEKCASVSAIQILASRLDDTMLAELLNLDNSMVVTLHVKAYDQAEAIKVVKQKLSDLDRTKIDEQMKAARSGYDIDILPADLNLYGKAAREILDMLQSKDQRLFLLTFLVMNTADSKAKLKTVIEVLKSMTQPKECPIIPPDYQQEDGMISSLPLGINRIEIQRIMTTSALAVLIPFKTMEWADKSPEALYCGINSLSGNMILVDRKNLSNGNAIILGKPGGGKSMVAKTEIEQVKYYTHDDIMICDPESEYSPMVWAMEGQVIRIAPNSTDYINPLDINLESYAPGESPLQLKAEFVLSLCEMMLGDKEGLQTIQKSVIDSALQIIYRPFFADPRKENLPVLGDLYEALREMNTERADNVADALEIYVTGSLNLFDHQTNVDVNNRVVCYDIRDLGTQLKPAGMFIVQEQVWSRVAANREKGKYTRYYMDEFHVLLQTPQTAAYSVQIWKRFRKYGGLPMGITQNINDLTRNQGTDNILNNTSYIYMLNQSAGDRKDLAAHLNLSPHQLKKVTDSAPGVGLLYCENAIIPIESHIPEDTKLYTSVVPGDLPCSIFFNASLTGSCSKAILNRTMT